MRKYSKQREAIRRCVSGRFDHPSAEQIYSELKDGNPGLSRGTVYRNLNLLAEDGEIARIDCGDGVERFDCCTGLHGHFICDVCGTIFDIQPEEGCKMVDCVEGRLGAKISGANIVFHGICKNCQSGGTAVEGEL